MKVLLFVLLAPAWAGVASGPAANLPKTLLAFPPASSAWQAQLAARLPSLAGATPKYALGNVLGPVAYAFEQTGVSAKTFAAMPLEAQRAAVKEAARAAKAAVDDAVWDDIRRVSQNAPSPLLEALAVRLGEAVSTYGAYLGEDTTRTAGLARDFCLARLRAEETAKRLADVKDPGAVPVPDAAVAVTLRLEKRWRALREQDALPIDRAPGRGALDRVAPLTDSDKAWLYAVPAVTGLLTGFLVADHPGWTAAAVGAAAWLLPWLKPLLGGRKDGAKHEAANALMLQFICGALGYLIALIAVTAGR